LRLDYKAYNEIYSIVSFSFGKLLLNFWGEESARICGNLPFCDWYYVITEGMLIGGKNENECEETNIICYLTDPLFGINRELCQQKGLFGKS
jgi:hypothetical protein